MSWKYSRNGKINGPVSQEELAELIRSGQLGPNDLVFTASLGSWQPVRVVWERWPELRTANGRNAAGENADQIEPDEAAGDNITSLVTKSMLKDLAVAEKITPTSAPTVASAPASGFTLNRKTMFLGLAGGGVLLVLLIFVFWPRDNWISRNKPILLDMYSTARMLKAQNHLKEALAQYETMFQLVGHNPIDDKDLNRVIITARREMDDLQTELSQVATGPKRSSMAPSETFTPTPRPVSNQGADNPTPAPLPLATATGVGNSPNNNPTPTATANSASTPASPVSQPSTPAGIDPDANIWFLVLAGKNGESSATNAALKSVQAVSPFPASPAGIAATCGRTVNKPLALDIQVAMSALPGSPAVVRLSLDQGVGKISVDSIAGSALTAGPLGLALKDGKGEVMGLLKLDLITRNQRLMLYDLVVKADRELTVNRKALDSAIKNDIILIEEAKRDIKCTKCSGAGTIRVTRTRTEPYGEWVGWPLYYMTRYRTIKDISDETCTRCNGTGQISPDAETINRKAKEAKLRQDNMARLREEIGKSEESLKAAREKADQLPCQVQLKGAELIFQDQLETAMSKELEAGERMKKAGKAIQEIDSKVKLGVLPAEELIKAKKEADAAVAAYQQAVKDRENLQKQKT